MKKFLLIGLAVASLGIASAPRADAGVSIGIGFGGPVGYYPPYYGYRPYYGHRPYYRHRPYYGYRPHRVVYRPHYHWYHGRRIYHARGCW